MTPQQTGGRFEHFRLVLGIVLTLQARLVQRQGSLLQVADLVRGFESVPRNMLRWLLRHAGLKGWQWLIPDIALGKELMRVRVGRMLGSLAVLEHNSIGQGKRSGVHLFGVYTKALLAAVNSVHQGIPIDLQSPEPVKFPFQQYVDDAIAIAESPVELQAITVMQPCMVPVILGGVNLRKGRRSLGSWRAVPNRYLCWKGACGALCGQIPAQVNQIKVLGILLDSQLSFLPLFSQAVAELQNIGGKLASGLSSHGFGLPAVASQFMTRVLPAALHGCELLISSNLEWTQVAKQLNEAQYIVAKAFLGCPKIAHLGSHVAVLAETRFLTRAGTWLAKKHHHGSGTISMLT